VAVAPYIVPPGHNLAAGIEIGLDINRHSSAHGRPGQFIRARPLQAHGPARHGARHQHSVKGCVVGAVVAKASRTLEVLNDNAFHRTPKRNR
jgi:hypothetical protein